MGISPVGNSGRFPQGKPAATKSRYPTLMNYKAHAGSFRVSIIHRTLTWPTGSLTCVRDHSCVFAYTRGLGTPTASQHNILIRKTLTNLSCAPGADGVRTLGPRGSRVRRATHGAPLSPLPVMYFDYSMQCNLALHLI